MSLLIVLMPGFVGEFRSGTGCAQGARPIGGANRQRAGLVPSSIAQWAPAHVKNLGQLPSAPIAAGVGTALVAASGRGRGGAQVRGLALGTDQPGTSTSAHVARDVVGLASMGS